MKSIAKYFTKSNQIIKFCNQTSSLFTKNIANLSQINGLSITPKGVKFDKIIRVGSVCNKTFCSKITKNDNSNFELCKSLKEINSQLVNQIVYVVARIQRSRKKGKVVFLTLREGIDTCQAVFEITDSSSDSSKNQLKDLASIRNESLIELKCEVVKAFKQVEKCTIKDIELKILDFKIISQCQEILPFQIEDAQNTSFNYEIKEANETKEIKEKDKKELMVKTSTRLDNRVLDIRVPTTHSIMKIQSCVGNAFRDYLLSQDFIEIHTPKIIAGASEGGTSVFSFDYFNEKVCLAQSPQLYKQMSVIGGLEKVFEIAPVFRAENSTGNRHMTEFTMLDIEMSLSNILIKSNNKEYKKNTEGEIYSAKLFYLMQFIHNTLKYTLDRVNIVCKKELDCIGLTNKFNHLVYHNEPVFLDYQTGVNILNEEGVNQKISDDLNDSNEKTLGEIVKKRYKTDFYFLYGFPTSVRPFYTKRIIDNKDFTYSFDAYFRGEEILSGAIREHNYENLLHNVKENNINPSQLDHYLSSFKLGVPEHGGCGIGLERIVKLILDLKNVKICALFPRDPMRIRP